MDTAGTATATKPDSERIKTLQFRLTELDKAIEAAEIAKQKLSKQMADNQLMAQLEEKLVERIMSQVEERFSMEIKTLRKNGPEEI
jgi:hypothetical protein